MDPKRSLNLVEDTRFRGLDFLETALRLSLFMPLCQQGSKRVLAVDHSHAGDK
jgi:hypothetical protein